MKKKHVLFGVFGLILLLFSDQITKYLATQYLKDSEGIPLLKDIFELQYLENHGAAFGIMEGQRFLFSDHRDIGASGNLQSLKITPQKKG